MKIYYQDPSVVILHGDCREILPALKPSLFWPDAGEKFDLLLTDPPYGIDYLNFLPSSNVFNKIAGDDAFELMKFAIEYSSQVVSAVIFGAANCPQFLPNGGRWLCWDKRVHEKADCILGSPFELAWMNKKSGFYEMIRVQHAGFINADGDGKRQHPTQKPVKLFTKIMTDVYPKASKIIDPFAGGCTTGRAAKDLGRQCVCIELEEKYCEIGARRMQQEVLTFPPKKTA